MSAISTASSFIENAPPGELSEVIKDIESLLEHSPRGGFADAVAAYNKQQYVTTKLPGSSGLVIVSSYNEIEEGRFFDSESSTSFAFNHTTQKASDVQSYSIEGEHASTVKSLVQAVGNHVKEHFPSLPAHGVYPTDDGIAILIVGNKYSPSNYWNGRWRSTYIYNPSASTLTGTIAVDVHYYEDGNVRLVTEKAVSENLRSSTSAGIVTTIASVEKKYQEELNRAFGALSEGAFKSLRRQLPVTRQKMDWDKAAAYKLGQDIGGAGKSR
ncbi:hypothetical protein H072_4075 [Dactylellina haptotyla CBS 200.50]|uniref:F-actin-capping protein subunit alpha n=1 Tax=Dactylellina haptotyla (strain CBS 200.50) TaxID=1284197 RepID=S8BRD1_DACHA|nr:hypothetical protein H072_4075 [Dactylellina haptotyla CBS 200.50]